MRMRTTTIGILGISSIALAGCGSSKTFANRPRPPVPVNLTVYINNARVSVSPHAVGAGPIVFIVTNQAARAESLARAGSGVTPNVLLFPQQRGLRARLHAHARIASPGACGRDH